MTASKAFSRTLTATVLAGLILGAVALVGAIRNGDQETIPSTSLSTYRHHTGMWQITYPARFDRGELPEPQQPRIVYDGIWLSNGATPRFSDMGGPDFAEFPEGDVAVVVYQVSGGPAWIPQSRDSRFPISFEDLKVRGGIYEGAWRWRSIQGNGERYTIEIRMGPDSSSADRKAASEIISSFRMVPLRQGTATGGHMPFYVLGNADFYPVGSVTSFHRSALPRSDYGEPEPFYLVRVPRGFYALAWPDDLQDGYKHCDVSYDSDSKQFSCPSGARWSLDGSVIDKPAPGLPGDPLSVLLVRVSVDDHVLVTPTVTMSSPRWNLEVT
jgi:hypothetical protein